MIAVSARAVPQEVDAVRHVVRARRVRERAGAGWQDAAGCLERAWAQGLACVVVHKGTLGAASACACARIVCTEGGRRLGPQHRPLLLVRAADLLAEGGEALRALVLGARSAPLHDERLADEMAALRAYVGLAMHGRLARRGWRRGERAPFHELGA